MLNFLRPKFNSIHDRYRAFYEKHKDELPSKRECARRFFDTLSPTEQKLYRDVHHAVEQLTAAYRRHIKNQN